MDIRQAAFGEMFATAFTVGLAFHAALFAAGVLIAFINPGFFHSGQMGMQVPASTPFEALPILIMMALFLVLANLVISSGGAGLLIVGRTLGWFEKKRA